MPTTLLGGLFHGTDFQGSAPYWCLMWAVRVCLEDQYAVPALPGAKSNKEKKRTLTSASVDSLADHSQTLRQEAASIWNAFVESVTVMLSQASSAKPAPVAKRTLKLGAQRSQADEPDASSRTSPPPSDWLRRCHLCLRLAIRRCVDVQNHALWCEYGVRLLRCVERQFIQAIAVVTTALIEGEPSTLPKRSATSSSQNMSDTILNHLIGSLGRYGAAPAAGSNGSRVAQEVFNAIGLACCGDGDGESVLRLLSLMNVGDRLWAADSGADGTRLFIFPVSDADAPGYSKVIQQPMSVATIYDRIRCHDALRRATDAAAALPLLLQASDIRTFEELCDDVEGLVRNAAKYNGASSPIAAAARKLADATVHSRSVKKAVPVLFALFPVKRLDECLAHAAALGCPEAVAAALRQRLAGSPADVAEVHAAFWLSTLDPRAYYVASGSIEDRLLSLRRAFGAGGGPSGAGAAAARGTAILDVDPFAPTTLALAPLDLFSTRSIDASVPPKAKTAQKAEGKGPAVVGGGAKIRRGAGAAAEEQIAQTEAPVVDDVSPFKEKGKSKRKNTIEETQQAASAPPVEQSAPVDSLYWMACDACNKWRVVPVAPPTKYKGRWTCALLERSCEEVADDDAAVAPAALVALLTDMRRRGITGFQAPEVKQNSDPPPAKKVLSLTKRPRETVVDDVNESRADTEAELLSDLVPEKSDKKMVSARSSRVSKRGGPMRDEERDGASAVQAKAPQAAEELLSDAMPADFDDILFHSAPPPEEKYAKEKPRPASPPASAPTARVAKGDRKTQHSKKEKHNPTKEADANTGRSDVGGAEAKRCPPLEGQLFSEIDRELQRLEHLVDEPRTAVLRTLPHACLHYVRAPPLLASGTGNMSAMLEVARESHTPPPRFIQSLDLLVRASNMVDATALRRPARAEYFFAHEDPPLGGAVTLPMTEKQCSDVKAAHRTFIRRLQRCRELLGATTKGADIF